MEAHVYVERLALNTQDHVLQAAQGIEKAFQLQIENKGFSFIELLSSCPTNWKMSPVKAAERIENQVIPYFPLGVLKDVE